ncbi:uncharacterized protein P884DRAFT_271710 [Thermothelomyces heterothallicus CBS 202.75]|uniref:uncharacterized protein n=1 Tax=Thermothelomyces heterothallicus CBS 202.75 TaxID=1149848 RepID=UPI00374391BC
MTSSLPPDPWKVLGVDRNADKAEIRTAYKKLVLKCHPDKIQDPTLKTLKADEFQKVQQAWELLNDDAEKAKYEQKLRLAELQRAAKVHQDVKNSPNTSVPRTAKYTTFEVRTAEPTSKYKSSPSGGKVYTYTTATHARSYEEVPSTRIYAEERERKVEKKRLERDREREREKARKRDADEKARYTKQPYVEHYESYISGLEDLVLEDEMYVMSGSKSDKKRSSSKKHDETRERDRERDREKSSSRRAKSPHVASDRKHADLLEFAAEYLARTGSSGASQKAMGASQQAMAWMSEDPPSATFVAPTVPTPPPVEFVEEESIRLSAPRTTGRRASNDAARSREKLKYDLDDTPSKGRPIPTLSKSYSTPPPVPESPPRISRSKTVPHESYTAMPSLSRTQTWAPGATSTADYYDDVESEDDRDRRRRRSRRTRSPSGQGAQRYKVDGSLKTSKIETQYSYGESPSSTRRYMTSEVYDSHLGHSPSSVSYSSTGLRYKQAKAIGPEDVMYAQYDPPVSYSYSSHTAEGYGVQA